MIERAGPLLLWVIIGVLMAVLFVISQEKSITLINEHRNALSLGKIYLFSFFRIIASSVILLFAFLQSITSGLVCLISFIVMRWFALLFLLKKARGEA
jgi:hypothetical protein